MTCTLAGSHGCEDALGSEKELRAAAATRNPHPVSRCLLEALRLLFSRSSKKPSVQPPSTPKRAVANELERNDRTATQCRGAFSRGNALLPRTCCVESCCTWCDRGVNGSDVRGVVVEEGTLEYWGNLTSHRKLFQRSLLLFTTFTLPHPFSFWPALSFQHDCSVSTLSALRTALTIVEDPRLRVAVMSSRVGDKQLAQPADCEGSLQKGAEAMFYHNSFLRCLTFQTSTKGERNNVKKQASHIFIPGAGDAQHSLRLGRNDSHLI